MRILTLALLLGLTACSPNGASDPAPQDPAAAKVAEPTKPPAPVPGEPVEPQPQPMDSDPGDPTKAGEPVAAQPHPEPARRVPEELLTENGVYYSCKTSADCEVKNVGNCCGYYPACVNKDSPTFPEKVKAACAAEGSSSICGFPEISSCDCIEGRCAPVTGPGGGGEVR